MIWALLTLLLLSVLVAGYRARAAWSPFTSRGRRRGVYWWRGWWAGQQAQNRDEH